MSGVTKVWSLETGGELWLFETSDLEVRTNFCIFSQACALSMQKDSSLIK
jgi:hypothetical protein